MQQYNSPAVEIYGSEGTIQMLGDDWEPKGFEIWRNKRSSWELYKTPYANWPWASGFTHLVDCILNNTKPLIDLDHAYHVKLNPLRGLRRAGRKVPKVVPYNPDARDGDNDGLRQEGTIWERPAGTSFFDKLGQAMQAGLRGVPSGARIMDGDGNEVDYKPGDRSLNARGREGRRARRGQRRLRRGERQMARADRNERRAGEIEKLDEQIALVDAAASDGSMERLIDAEEIRGDEPMDANYRGFWDNFIEGFTGVQQGRRRDQGEGGGARGGRRENATAQFFA